MRRLLSTPVLALVSFVLLFAAASTARSSLAALQEQETGRVEVKSGTLAAPRNPDLSVDAEDEPAGTVALILDWDAPTGTEPASYAVYQWVSGETYTLLASVPASQTSYRHEGVAIPSTSRYKVASVLEAWQSDFSSTVSCVIETATPGSCSPP